MATRADADVRRLAGAGPGALYDGRDLKPTMRLDAFIGGAVAEHFAIDPARATATLFPGAARGKSDRGAGAGVGGEMGILSPEIPEIPPEIPEIPEILSGQFRGQFRGQAIPGTVYLIDRRPTRR